MRRQEEVGCRSRSRNWKVPAILYVMLLSPSPPLPLPSWESQPSSHVSQELLAMPLLLCLLHPPFSRPALPPTSIHPALCSVCCWKHHISPLHHEGSGHVPPPWQLANAGHKVELFQGALSCEHGTVLLICRLLLLLLLGNNFISCHLVWIS